ncbi:MAG: transporter substrate-binding domain-containing protein [Methylococcaceae bacterium]|nr:transporter substrate-binding domain-containing protein [Methylococcaceae bacterium]
MWQNILKNLIVFCISLMSSFVYAGDSTVNLTEAERLFVEGHPDIVLGSGDSFEPFSILNSDGSISGFDIDIMALVSKKTGLNITFSLGSWVDMQAKAKERQVDGLSSVVITESRKQYYNFTEPYLKYYMLVIVKKGNPQKITIEEELNGKRIALQTGNEGFKNVAKSLGKNVEFIYFDTIHELIKAVVSGEVDFTILDETANYLAQLVGLSNSIEEAFVINDKPTELVFALRNDQPELVSIINKALITLAPNELFQIRQKWFGHNGGPQRITFSAEESAYLAENPIIKLCISSADQPFSTVDKKGNYAGMVVDVVRLLQQRSDNLFQLVPSRNEAESIEFLKKEICEVASLKETQHDYKGVQTLAEAYISYPLVIATRTDALFIERIENLVDKRLLILKGESKSVKARYPHINLTEVNTVQEGLQLVQNNKAYGVIGALPQLSYHLQQEGFIDLKISGRLEEREGLTFVILNNNSILRSIMQKTLALISEKEKREIYNSWFSTRFEQGINYRLVWQVVFISGLLFLVGIYWNRKQNLLNQQLHNAKEKAETATQEKTHFLANMSHELRTPLNGIVSMVQLTGQSDLNEKQKQYLEIITRSADNLNTIINDLLDLSKIESDKLQLHYVDFDLVELITDVMALNIGEKEDGNLNFKVHYQGVDNNILYGDSLRLRQILNNLVSNAVKFTKKGQITLEVSKQSSLIYRFTVSDTGIGLDNNQQENVFQPFTQAELTTTRQYGGTGLGLSISKQLVEVMGGTIWLESQLGKGSQFSFEIPLKGSEKSSQYTPGHDRVLIARLKTELKAFKGQAILLVDDEETNQTIIQLLLEDSGINIDIANNGREGIDKFSLKHYSLVLMDIQMPIMDGYEAMHEMKALNSKVPVIALTASALTHKANNSAGMDAYLIKPINVSVFYSLLLTQLKIND